MSEQAVELNDLRMSLMGSLLEAKTRDDVDKDSFIEIMSRAVEFAENNPKNHGVLSIETDNPRKVVRTSVKNNLNRWLNNDKPAPWINEKPKRFIDFMQRRWAPVGAENDPNNLNKNWSNNVRFFLKNTLGEEIFNKLHSLEITKKGEDGHTNV